MKKLMIILMVLIFIVGFFAWAREWTAVWETRGDYVLKIDGYTPIMMRAYYHDHNQSNKLVAYRTVSGVPEIIENDAFRRHEKRQMYDCNRVTVYYIEKSFQLGGNPNKFYNFLRRHLW